MSGFDDFVARWRRSLAFPSSEIDHFVDEHRHELETLYADERALRGGWPGSVADFLALERLARSERLLGGRSDDEALGHIKGVVARRGGGGRGRDHAVARALALALGREGWATIDLLNDRPLVAVFVDRELVAIVSATGRVAPRPGHERTAAPFEALVEHGLERIRAFDHEIGPGVPLDRFARALWTRARAGTLASSPLQWFELYNPEGGVPVEESAGYRRALVAAEQVFESVLWVLDQPPIDLDVLPALDSLGSTRYDLDLEEGDDEFGAAVSPDELPALVGTDVYGWTPEETGDLIGDVMDAESRGGYRTDALIKHEIARQIWLAEGRLELASIDKESACCVGSI